MKSFISASLKAGLVAVIISAVMLSFGFKDSKNSDDVPGLNIKVVKHLLPNEVQSDAEVIVTIAGTNTEVASGLTNSQGLFSTPLQAGYYDIRVWYPERPNNYQSAQKLNHYHHNQNIVTIMLGPQY